MPRSISQICAALSLVAVIAATPAAANVYDSNVVQKLKLTGAQRAKVQLIVNQGRSEFRRIMRKHKIDPNAKPQMSKLMNASSELMAYRRKQRERIRPILSPEQLRRYDEIMEETARRVQRAAQ